jgi:Alpha/beta hydrolase domain
VPRVNTDGNETSGVPSVQLQVPLGTYTGFNELAAGYGKGGNCVFFGGFIPFAKTKAERAAKGDPRLSLEERYGDHAGFVAKVREAVTKQQAEGWLLPDDAARLLKEAEAANVLK